ncbi:MAG TPA: hypothetical protein VNG71_03575 [Pyrinomonadaceae bacterium]|nr:hypothetical protein [Pyrinomonadaceae bacterium]
MLGYQFLKPVHFATTKAATPIQADRIESELRETLVTLDVNVQRFTPIARVKEEPVRSNSEYRRH